MTDFELPEWISNPSGLGRAAGDNPGIITTLIRFGREPTNYIREVVLNIVLAFVANIVFTTTDLTDRGTNAVISPFTSVRISITDAVASAGDALIDPITVLNSWISTGLADSLGIGAFPILVTVYVVEVALAVAIAAGWVDPNPCAFASFVGDVVGAVLDAVGDKVGGVLP